MKVAILNDLHFGANGAKDIYLNELNYFLDSVFFNNIKNIDAIVIAGDTLDDRRSLNIRIVSAVNTLFKRLNDLNIPIYIILGNHDIYYKNATSVNSITSLLSHGLYTNIKIVGDDIEIFNNMYMVPWICNENRELIESKLKDVNKNDNIIAIGHFNIIGFEYQAGIKSDSGYSRNFFKNFKMVLSGHYHKKSKQENVLYMGTQYQFKWSDYGEIKGFHILDTETYNIKFIKNSRELYYKIFMADGKIKKTDPIKWLKDNYAELSNKFIKLYITGKYSSKVVEEFIATLNNVGIETYEFTVVDNLDAIASELNLMEKEIQELNNVSTLSMFLETANNLELDDSDLSKVDLKNTILGIYNQAMEL